MNIDYAMIMENLLAALPQVGVYLKNKDRKVIWKSSKLINIFGDTDIVDHFSDSVIRDARNIDDLILSGELDKSLSRYSITLPNGVEHPLLIQKTPYLEGDEITGIIVVLFDLGAGFLTKLTEQDKNIAWTALNNCINDAIRKVNNKIKG